jgi:hypothetical protein
MSQLRRMHHPWKTPTWVCHEDGTRCHLWTAPGLGHVLVVWRDSETGVAPAIGPKTAEQ